MKTSLLWQYDCEHCLPAVAGGLPENGDGFRGIVGIDEAGRGSWVGPVVAAAAWLPRESYALEQLRSNCLDIDDSKKLTRARREAVFERLRDWRDSGLLCIAAGEASVAEIEAHNVIGATALAMRRAVTALELPFRLPAGAAVKVGGKIRAKKAIGETSACAASEPTVALQGDFFTPAIESLTTGKRSFTVGTQGNLFAVADGVAGQRGTGDFAVKKETVCAAQPDATGRADPCTTAAPSDAAIQNPSGSLQEQPHVWVDGLPMAKRLPWAHRGIVSGDATSLAIAIASIWAKVTRDRLLAKLALECPHYGWEINAGYGTPSHCTALRTHGRSIHHRPKFLLKQGL